MCEIVCSACKARREVFAFPLEGRNAVWQSVKFRAKCLFGKTESSNSSRQEESVLFGATRSKTLQ